MFPGLTTTERQAAAADGNAALFDRATIRRKTGTTWADVAVDVPARMRVNSRDVHQTLTDAAASGTAPCSCAFQPGVDVWRLDRVTVNGLVMVVEVVEPDRMIHTMAHGQLLAAA